MIACRKSGILKDPDPVNPVCFIDRSGEMFNLEQVTSSCMMYVMM